MQKTRRPDTTFIVNILSEKAGSFTLNEGKYSDFGLTVMLPNTSVVFTGGAVGKASLVFLLFCGVRVFLFVNFYSSGEGVGS